MRLRPERTPVKIPLRVPGLRRAAPSRSLRAHLATTRPTPGPTTDPGVRGLQGAAATRGGLSDQRSTCTSGGRARHELCSCASGRAPRSRESQWWARHTGFSLALPYTRPLLAAISPTPSTESALPFRRNSRACDPALAAASADPPWRLHALLALIQPAVTYTGPPPLWVALAPDRHLRVVLTTFVVEAAVCAPSAITPAAATPITIANRLATTSDQPHVRGSERAGGAHVPIAHLVLRLGIHTPPQLRSEDLDAPTAGMVISGLASVSAELGIRPRAPPEQDHPSLNLALPDIFPTSDIHKAVKKRPLGPR